MENDRGFERVSNQFFLARLFHCLADDPAKFEEFLDLFANRLVEQVALRLGK